MRRSLSSDATDRGRSDLGNDVRVPCTEGTVDLATGAAIINSRGVPGTLGFFAITRHDRRAVLVTSHHVLFGSGARAGEPVWIADKAGRQSLKPIGRTAYGRAATVGSETSEAWIDCAVAIVDMPKLAFAADENKDVPATDVGARVSKTGAATGRTEGTLISVDHADRVVNGVRRIAVSGQMLLRSTECGRPFCAAGDSGAALRDERGRLIGLMWGITPLGDGVACPIAPVLKVLHVFPCEPTDPAHRMSRLA
jgi:hypothetical protein